MFIRLLAEDFFRINLTSKTVKLYPLRVKSYKCFPKTKAEKIFIRVISSISYVAWEITTEIF